MVFVLVKVFMPNPALSQTRYYFGIGLLYTARPKFYNKRHTTHTTHTAHTARTVRTAHTYHL